MLGRLPDSEVLGKREQNGLCLRERTTVMGACREKLGLNKGDEPMINELVVTEYIRIGKAAMGA